MKTKLFLAAAVAALSLGGAAAHAAPASLANTDIVSPSTGSAVEEAKVKFYFGYYGYPYGYYYYKPYYYYQPYCYWTYYGKVCRYY